MKNSVFILTFPFTLALSLPAIAQVNTTSSGISASDQPPEVVDAATGGAQEDEPSSTGSQKSELPYYVPVGAERLPEQKPPVVQAPPPAPGQKYAIGAFIRTHKFLDSPGGQTEMGAIFRFGRWGNGFSLSAMNTGNFAISFESLGFLGITIYEGPVKLGLSPNFYAGLEWAASSAGIGVNPRIGFSPELRITGCQGLPWFVGVGGHLTNNVWISGAFSQYLTGGFVLEMGLIGF
ncbi:MAG: hypothetical protein MK135_11060 [Polyangiaceae bacterium]|nr:hypothetical protein [Polyangiaceae bacterium]